MVGRAGAAAGDSLSVALDVEPLGTRMLMTVEQSFVLTAIEGLLGGSHRPPRERRFSEIDWRLTRRLFESIVHQLSLVWHDLAGISLTIGVDLPNDTGQIASVSEPTLVVMIESRINKLSSTLALLIPWMAIEPIADRSPVARSTARARDSGMKRAMSAVPVTIRAEVAALEMPIADVLSLEPGSVIRLGTQARQGISMFAENVRIGERPARRQRRAARNPGQ